MFELKQMTKKLINAALRRFDFELVRHSELGRLREYERDFHSIQGLPRSTVARLESLAERSKSQLKQDLFVLTELDFKRNGFFVEFGATNGVDLSNSYLLEKDFGWRGILAEPAKCWHSALRENRLADIETRCVYSDSISVLNFNEVDSPELSTISAYSSSDAHHEARKKGSTYTVNSISLLDLLDKYNAPLEIDYLSIDTEGSEYEILRNFAFGKYRFNIITCEHNFTPMREKIHQLLTKNGYARKYIGLSMWDDWYTRLK